MAPPSASSCSSNISAPYKLPAAPLIARNLSTLLSNGSTSSSTLPIEALRDLLSKSRPPLLSSDEAQAGSSAAPTHAQTEPLDGLPIIDPLNLLLTTSSNSSLQAQLHTPQARAGLLDLAQGLALALARPQDGDSVAAAGATPAQGSRSGSSASASASGVLSLVETRLLLAACYVVLALLPPATNAGEQSRKAGSGKTDPAARLAQASTQVDVARDELREAQRSHQLQVKRRRNGAPSSSLAAGQAASPSHGSEHEDDLHLNQQLSLTQARLLLASANVAHLAGRPEHEVKRLLGWWAKARGQAEMQMEKGSGSGSGAEGTRGDKAEGARVEG